MTTINSNVDKIRNKLYQRRSPSRSIAAAMAQTEGAASALPPFYRRPAVLAAARHFGLSYVPIGDYRFARASNSIPLTVAEFVAGGAALSDRVHCGVAGHVGGDRRVRCRRQSFRRRRRPVGGGRLCSGLCAALSLSSSSRPDDKTEFMLAIDEAAEVLKPGDANPVFRGAGQPTEIIRQALAFCSEYPGQPQRDARLLRRARGGLAARAEGGGVHADDGPACPPHRLHRRQPRRGAVQHAAQQDLPRVPQARLGCIRSICSSSRTANWAEVIDRAAAAAAPRAGALALARNLAAAACAGDRADWVNPDAAADYDRDRNTCAAQAEILSPPTYDPRTRAITSDPLETLRLGDQCMRSRGWRLAAPKS